jgi:putative PIN family toxin of toxin-antitoxin system
MLRIVLDTNVLVSAILTEGRSRELFQLAIHGRYLLINSKETIEEFEEVLRRSKFKMTESEIARTRNALIRTGRTVKVTSKRRIIKQDPDDDVFVNLALDGRADYIVSGDPHLLTLAKYKGIEIVKVSDMLQKLSH